MELKKILMQKRKNQKRIKQPEPDNNKKEMHQAKRIKVRLQNTTFSQGKSNHSIILDLKKVRQMR